MAYIRKTVDVFEVQQLTPEGWECVTTETTRREAQVRAKEYRENQPEFIIKIIKKRENICT